MKSMPETTWGTMTRPPLPQLLGNNEPAYDHQAASWAADLPPLSKLCPRMNLLTLLHTPPVRSIQACLKGGKLVGMSVTQLLSSTC